MNRFIFCALLIMIATPSWAEISPTMQQYKDANRQNLWNNMTDSLHTIGQNPKKASLTKKKLHATRAQNRLKNIKAANKKKWVNSK